MSSSAARPYFDDLVRGQAFRGAPAVTLTSGLVAAHRAIVGDRLALALEDRLGATVTGRPGFAHPAIVWDIAVGQSTLATRRVIANLFYRGLVFHRSAYLGDTLHTTTEVIGLKENTRNEGRAPTGLAALRITTVDQDGNLILDFWRCAMLPLRSPAKTGYADDLDAVGQDVTDAQLRSLTASWDLRSFREKVSGGHFAAIAVGDEWTSGGDVVSSAPELARLTLNIAEVHHDALASASGRLVYGGHTIGLALAQANRELPDMLTVVGWHSCDHTGPVSEGDTLRSVISVERVDPLEGGGGLVHLRSQVAAQRERTDAARDVLDWRFVVAMA